MGIIFGTRRSTPASPQVQRIRRYNLSRKWFLLVLDRGLPPLAALVGSNGQLYWRLEDVSRLAGQRITTGVSGKDILLEGGNAYQLSCQFLSTERVCDVLRGSVVGREFQRAITSGQCMVSVHFGRRYDIQPEFQRVFVLTLAEASVPALMETFKANRTLLRHTIAKTNGNTRRRIYLPRECKMHRGNSPEMCRFSSLRPLSQDIFPSIHENENRLRETGSTGCDGTAPTTPPPDNEHSISHSIPPVTKNETPDSVR